MKGCRVRNRVGGERRKQGGEGEERLNRKEGGRECGGRDRGGGERMEGGDWGRRRSEEEEGWGVRSIFCTLGEFASLEPQSLGKPSLLDHVGEGRQRLGSSAIAGAPNRGEVIAGLPFLNL